MANPNPKDRRYLGSQAKRAAYERLIELHPEDWKQVYGEEREKLGLRRESERAKNPRKTDLLREQLRAAGIEPVA